MKWNEYLNILDISCRSNWLCWARIHCCTWFSPYYTNIIQNIYNILNPTELIIRIGLFLYTISIGRGLYSKIFEIWSFICEKYKKTKEIDNYKCPMCFKSLEFGWLIVNSTSYIPFSLDSSIEIKLIGD